MNRILPDDLSVLNDHLYSAFPALMTTGVVVWMVNLLRGPEIVHGEGATFRKALSAAVKKFNN